MIISRKTHYKIALAAFLLFSCRDKDLEKKLDDLSNQIIKVKQINDVLELKNFILDKKLSEILVSKVSLTNGEVGRIDFENGNAVEISAGIITSYTTDMDYWKATFNFSDSTAIETDFLGNNSFISESNIVLNPFNNAPLSARIKIISPVKGLFQLKVVGQNGEKSDIVINVKDFSFDHTINVYGLYPDYSNQVVLTFKSKDGVDRVSNSIVVATKQLPDGFPDFNVIKQYQTVESNVLFLVDYRPAYIPFMVDAFGKIRWYSTGFSQVAKYGLQRFRNGNMGFGRAGNSQGSVFEYTMLGELIKEYSFYPAFENVHHDVFEMPNENFLVTVNKVGIPTIDDHIIEIERNSGVISNIWDLRQVLPIDRYTLTKSGNGSDWFHNNAVIYDENDNSIIVSGQAQGIVKLTWDNKLKWILAPHEGWKSEYVPFLLVPASQPDFEWNWGQHRPTLMPNGDLLLFDNGFGREFGHATSQYSRAVEYTIKEAPNQIGGNVSQVWQYGKERGSEMFASFISSTDYLEESNSWLISAGSLAYDFAYTDSLHNSITPSTRPLNTRIIEVDNNKNVLFEMTLSSSSQVGSSYRSKKLKILDQ